MERRSFTWGDFIADLESYYDEQDCDVVFRMEDDGSCIAEFTVHPRGKRYFLDKKAFDPEADDPQAEALAELRRIFFADEPLAVREVVRRPGDDAADLVMVVEIE